MSKIKLILLATMVTMVLFGFNSMESTHTEKVENGISHKILQEKDSFKEIYYDENFGKYYLLTENWAIELEDTVNLNNEQYLKHLNKFYENSTIVISFTDFENIVSFEMEKIY